LDWVNWEETNRNDGLVKKVISKYDELNTQGYNIDSIDQGSTVNSEKFDIHAKTI